MTLQETIQAVLDSGNRLLFRPVKWAECYSALGITAEGKIYSYDDFFQRGAILPYMPTGIISYIGEWENITKEQYEKENEQ